jgi:hypothetical protein
MTASPAAQRRILREAKYPDEDEPLAMRLYYQDACDRVQAYHRNKHDPSWLRAKADDLAQLASLSPGPSGNRLRNNSRALRQYMSNFATRDFVPLGPLRLRIEFGDVRVSATPDLFITEGGKHKVIKFNFSTAAPHPDIVKIVSQCMYEASKGKLQSLSNASVLYLDVPRGIEHRGARAGARTLRDLEAACETITNVWDSIQPTRR